MALLGALQPTFDLLVDFTLDENTAEMVADRRQGWQRLVGAGDLGHEQLLICGLDFLHADRNVWSEPLLDKGLCCRNSEYKLIEIRPVKPCCLEIRGEGFFTSTTHDQQAANRLRVEIETVEDSAIFEIAEFDLESNPSFEKARPIGLLSFVVFSVDDMYQRREFEIAVQNRRVAYHGEDLFNGLPMRLTGNTEVTDSHEDESNNGGAHPAMIAACFSLR